MSTETVPKGYKRTEVGVIPEEWEVPNIGDITDKVGSGTTPKGGSARYHDSGRPFIRSQNVGWGRLDLSDVVYIDDETHFAFSGSEIQIDDILLNITGASIGRSTIADFRLEGGNVNQHVCIIRLKNNSATPKLINFLLLSTIGQSQIWGFQAGGNRQGLNFKQVRSIQLPISRSIAEQQAIAAALSDADALIESLESLLAKKRQIKQGAMQELLTGKRRLPGFTGKWSGLPLSSLSNKITDGEHLTPIRTEQGYYLLSARNVCDSRIDLSDVDYVGEAEYERIQKRCNPEAGDVLVSCSGTIGRVALVPNNLKCVLVRSAALIKPDRSVLNGAYLQYSLQCEYCKKQILASLNQGAQANLFLGHIEAIEIKLPPTLPEQTAIAAVLSDMDAELEALEAKLEKARQVKQGMMQQLLTGKVRLV